MTPSIAVLLGPLRRGVRIHCDFELDKPKAACIYVTWPGLCYGSSNALGNARAGPAAAQSRLTQG